MKNNMGIFKISDEAKDVVEKARENSWDRLPKSHKADKHNDKKEGVSSFSVTSLSIYVFIIVVLIGGLMDGWLAIALIRLVDFTVFMLERLLGV